MGEATVEGKAAGVKWRLEPLTGLRFFAAMAVVFRHYLFGMPTILQREASHGFVAVGFFFVLSGFVLTYSYSEADGRLRGTERKFFWARFARIYPAYLLALVASLPMFYLALRQFHGPTGTVIRMLTGGTLVTALAQSWLPWTANYLNAPAWSLSVEAFFYLMFPLILKLIRRLSKRWIVMLLAATWIAALAAPLTAWAVKGSLEGSIWYAAIQCLPILRVPQFLMGCLTARLFLISKAPGRIASPAAWLCAGGIGALLASRLPFPELVIGNGLFAPLFCLLLWFGSAAAGSFYAVFASPILIFLGEISYSIYILQDPVARWFRYVSGTAPETAFLPFVAVLMAMSALCFLYVEKPASRWILGWSQRTSRIHALKWPGAIWRKAGTSVEQPAIA